MLTIDGYIIDVGTAATPTYKSTITRYPIEDGAKMADHVVLDPIGLSVEGIVSDTPLGRVRFRREFMGELGNPTGAFHERMLELRKEKRPVIVGTDLGAYPNMMLATYSPVREGGSIRFTATFEEATFVTNERTVIVSTPSAQGKAKSTKMPAIYTDVRGRAIVEVFTPIGKMYFYRTPAGGVGAPVPQASLDRAIRDTYSTEELDADGNLVPLAQSEADGAAGAYRNTRPPSTEKTPWWQGDSGPAARPAGEVSKTQTRSYADRNYHLLHPGRG